MSTPDEVKRARKYVEELRLIVDGLTAPKNSCTRAAGSCFMIAQEHHDAIVRLSEWGLFAAAFALVRIEFEAYVRGEWLALCASDSVVEAFIEGKEPPKIDCLLAELEMLESFKQRELSQIKQKTWKAMCAYTHTGGLHIQRWNSEEGIGANYTRGEILQLVKYADMIAALAVNGVVRLVGDERLASRAFEALEKRLEP